MKFLSLEERLKVACYHNASAQHPNWELDTATGHMVCSLCGKPAPDIVLRICAECGNQFSIPLDQDWLPKYFVVANKVYEREFFHPQCY